MGFFSFIGKAVKSVAHVVGSVAKVAAPLALGGPLGAVAGKLGGSLLGSVLHSKSPMSSTPLKINILGSNRSIPILRAKPGGAVVSTPRIAAASPVMPGGSVATPAGIMAPGGGLPPTTYGTRAGGGKKAEKASLEQLAAELYASQLEEAARRAQTEVRERSVSEEVPGPPVKGASHELRGEHMGVTTWPCPGCGQQQRSEHPNGEAQENRLCAACREKAENEKQQPKRK